MNLTIAIVPPGLLYTALPGVLPYLQTSAQWSCGRAGVDDIIRMVLNGHMTLWAVFETGGGEGIHGHVVTEIKQYPKAKMLCVQYCAMKPHVMALVEPEMQTKAEQFARDTGCAGVEFVGRPGWRKTARKYGYEKESVLYQKFFGETK